jgi:hypothetical protein
VPRLLYKFSSVCNGEVKAGGFEKLIFVEKVSDRFTYGVFFRYKNQLRVKFQESSEFIGDYIYTHFTLKKCEAQDMQGS